MVKINITSICLNMSTLVLWLSFSVLLISCDHAEGNKTESCFLYPVNATTLSPKYDLKDNQNNYLTINHINTWDTKTRILDENKKTIVTLKYLSRENPPATDNSVVFSSDEAYTTLVFRRHSNKVTVYMRDSFQKEVTLDTNPKTIRVTTEGEVNAIFGCPGMCYEFEKAMIHKYYPEEQSGNTESFRIYGRIKDTTKPHGLHIRMFPGNYSITLGNILTPDSTRDGKWFVLQFEVTIKNEGQYHSIDFAVKVPATNTSLPFNRTIEASKSDLHLDFRGTFNIRWAAFCIPRPSKGESELGIIILCLVSGVCAVFLLVFIGQCVYIHYQRKQLKTLSQNTFDLSSSSPAMTAASVNSPTREANASEEELASHVYDYIDLEALNRQLELERSAAAVRCNVPRDEASREEEEEEDNFKKRNSHTSLNSLYGCVLNNN